MSMSPDWLSRGRCPMVGGLYDPCGGVRDVIRGKWPKPATQPHECVDRRPESAWMREVGMELPAPPREIPVFAAKRDCPACGCGPREPRFLKR